MIALAEIAKLIDEKFEALEQRIGDHESHLIRNQDDDDY